MANNNDKENNRSVTRQTIERDPKNPEDHLDSGYENSTSDDFAIAGVGIEDADIALHKLFDKDIGFIDRSIHGANGNVAIKKPYVIFATGERFAIAKKLRPPRDKNKKLMLPAISIRRTSFTQTTEDITGRGINQFTGNLVIKRKLDETDRDYQNLINKFAFQNMSGSLPSSRRLQGINQKDVEITNGGLLTPKLETNNMWEVITVPQPQFFTNTYEVVFWTNYTQHMNYLIETYVSSFLPQVRGHKLVTDKGYWFMAYTNDTFTSQENLEDFSEESRLLRYSFEITVKGFILVADHETNKVPVRKWISSPVITFEGLPRDDVHYKKDINKLRKKVAPGEFTLTDFERDTETSQTPTYNQRLVAEKKVVDPKTGQMVTKIVSVLESNQKQGETVYYATDRQVFEDFIKTLGN